jgi:hypothetical protein
MEPTPQRDNRVPLVQLPGVYQQVHGTPCPVSARRLYRWAVDAVFPCEQILGRWCVAAEDIPVLPLHFARAQAIAEQRMRHGRRTAASYEGSPLA